MRISPLNPIIGLEKQGHSGNCTSCFEIKNKKGGVIIPERPDTYYHNSAYDKFKGKCIAEGGTLHWADDEYAPVTRHGYLPFFSEFLKSGELFSEWVEECPIEFKSNNARK